MHWFEGSIAEAVAACKSRRAVFVVFVEGKDDLSKNTLATLEDNAISSQLETDDFIVIKLDSGTESYHQFAQIYQLVPVPSIFFIGPNGTPLEVVAGEVAVPDLAERIRTVLVKSGKTSSQDVTDPQQDEPASSTLQANGPVPSTSSAGVSPSIADKVERAKELIEIKRQQKQEEEEMAERNRELERRRMGQEVQKLRKWQQEQEVKEMREQKRKEKLEERAARQRVLDQINQDRAERAARMTTDTGKSQTQTEPREEARVPAPAPRSDVARIQFRLPDGSSHTHSFPADTPLAEVRAYAAKNLALPFREFAMSTTFPRREFSASDNCRSVNDLELVPTAVILILPASSAAVVSSPGYFDVVTRMIWSLLAPLAALLTYLRDLVFRRGNNSGGSSSGPSNPASNAASDTRTQTTRRRNVHADSASSIQRQGNIHRLSTRRDSSDDENNTWNGNSTQQM